MAATAWATYTLPRSNPENLAVGGLAEPGTQDGPLAPVRVLFADRIVELPGVGGHGQPGSLKRTASRPRDYCVAALRRRFRLGAAPRVGRISSGAGESFRREQIAGPILGSPKTISMPERWRSAMRFCLLARTVVLDDFVRHGDNLRSSRRGSIAGFRPGRVPRWRKGDGRTGKDTRRVEWRGHAVGRASKYVRWYSARRSRSAGTPPRCLLSSPNRTNSTVNWPRSHRCSTDCEVLHQDFSRSTCHPPLRGGLRERLAVPRAVQSARPWSSETLPRPSSPTGCRSARTREATTRKAGPGPLRLLPRPRTWKNVRRRRGFRERPCRGHLDHPRVPGLGAGPFDTDFKLRSSGRCPAASLRP